MKKILKLMLFFLMGIAGGVFAELVLLPYIIDRPVIETTEITIQENTALKDAVDKVEKTIVGIQGASKEGVLMGSGLILTSDGLIVTLAGLLPEGTESTLFLEGQPIPYQVLKKDLNLDLALIKIEKDNLPTVGFADLQRIRLGERVFLVGASFEEQEVKREVNSGIVKYFDKDAVRTNIFERASLSGSPLFNIEGELIGLNTVDFWGRVVAIPVTKIKTFAGF